MSETLGSSVDVGSGMVVGFGVLVGAVVHPGPANSFASVVKFAPGATHAETMKAITERYGTTRFNFENMVM